MLTLNLNINNIQNGEDPSSIDKDASRRRYTQKRSIMKSFSITLLYYYLVRVFNGQVAKNTNIIVRMCDIFALMKL